METYEIDTIKMEKEKAMQRYRIFKKIGNVVRTLEIFVAVTLISYSISWTSSFVPSAFNFCGAILRRISSVFFSTHFVFLIGNVIIIALFANFSSEKSGQDYATENVTVDVTGNVNVIVNVKPENDDVVVNEVVTSPATAELAVVEKVPEIAVAETDVKEKVYKRTRSAAARIEAVEAAKKVDIRTEIGGLEIVNCDVSAKLPAEEMRRRRRRFEEDELSNEEFRRKVEQFIEKQQMFLRQESKAVVLSSNNNSSNNLVTASKYSRSRSM